MRTDPTKGPSVVTKSIARRFAASISRFVHSFADSGDNALAQYTYHV